MDEACQNMDKIRIILETMAMRHPSRVLAQFEEVGRQYKRGGDTQCYRLKAEILRKTTMNVSEVAAASGFNDPLHFSRVFRKQVGVPPSVFRRGGDSTVIPPRQRAIQPGKPRSPQEAKANGSDQG